jgi:hypothetical protein
LPALFTFNGSRKHVRASPVNFSTTSQKPDCPGA